MIELLSHFMSDRSPYYGTKSVDRASATEFSSSTVDRGPFRVRTMRWSFPNHLGTHIDFPSHFLEDGITLSDYKPADFWFTRIGCLELPPPPDGKSSRVLTANDLEKSVWRGNCQDHEAELVFFRTGIAELRDNPATVERYIFEGPGFSADLAAPLAKRFPGLRCIGLDSISVSAYAFREEGRGAHVAFMKKGWLLIEDAKLDRLPSLIDRATGLLIAPTLVEKADGSPVSLWLFYS